MAKRAAKLRSVRVLGVRKGEPFAPPAPVALPAVNIVGGRGAFARKISTEHATPYSSEPKPCVGRPKRGLKKPCHVELTFVTPRLSQTSGVRPGAAIRFCSMQKEPGVLIPVDSPDEALAAARCACRGSAANCATPSGSTGIGAYRRARSSTFSFLDGFGCRVK